MRRYEVNLTVNGATSAIDNVNAEAGYTADQYLEDCAENADEDWNEMLSLGEVTLIDVTDDHIGFPSFYVQ